MQGENEEIPSLVEGTDLASMDLGPQEAFVLSCIDGVLGVADLADLVGLPPGSVRSALDKLTELGLVRWAPAPGSSAPLYSQAELDEDVDLDQDLRKRVLDTYHRADDITHYEVLGLPHDADRVQIRQAYFQLSKVFHPDTLYGKRLGSYKPKMEVVFRKLTDAYEVLGKKQKREGYDRYLASQELLRSAEQELSRGERKAQAIKRAVEQGVSIPSAAPEVGPGPEPESARPAAESPPPAEKPLSAKERRLQRKRDLLLVRLKGAATKLPAERFAPEKLARSPAEERKDALRKLTASLKRTAEFTGGIDRIQKHLMSAKVAEADDDLAKAASALRMALALAPDRPDILSEYRRINGTLQADLLKTHKAQAEYEEESKMWAAAAISWAKVAEGAPDDPVPPRRVATALWKATGDLKTARAYAQRAIELAPNHTETRVLLAQIYLAANMGNSALKELEAVMEQEPRNQAANNLLAKIRGK